MTTCVYIFLGGCLDTHLLLSQCAFHATCELTKNGVKQFKQACFNSLLATHRHSHHRSAGCHQIRERGRERAGGPEYPAGGGPGYKKDGRRRRRRRRRRSHAANCCHVSPRGAKFLPRQLVSPPRSAALHPKKNSLSPLKVV